ncbi:hypothetical protein HaLaN_27969, partial [Haematococcus lacustris]
AVKVDETVLVSSYHQRSSAPKIRDGPQDGPQGIGDHGSSGCSWPCPVDPHGRLHRKQAERVAEAELQAFQMQHGTDAAASQQRDQQMQAQIEEPQQQNARHRSTAYAAAEEMADLESQCFHCCL